MTIRTSYCPKAGCYAASDGQQSATGLSHAEARQNLVREQRQAHKFRLHNDAENVPVRFSGTFKRHEVRSQALRVTRPSSWQWNFRETEKNVSLPNFH